MMIGTSSRLLSPVQDRKGSFSPLKTATLLVMILPAAWTLYQYAIGNFGLFPLAGFTYWSGVWATALLILTLYVTPARVILRWNRLIAIRRMIGVTALAYSVAHLVIYFGLRFWDFSFIANEVVTRISLIVASVSLIGLIALGATSFDAAIRRMGAKGWDRLHNLNYILTGLALLHYLLSPGFYTGQYVMAGMFFWLMAWRLMNRRGLGASPTALATLALGTTVFTALFEAGWMWSYHGFPPAETLGYNIHPLLGIPATWINLGLALALALVALVVDLFRPRPLRRAKP